MSQPLQRPDFIGGGAIVQDDYFTPDDKGHMRKLLVDDGHHTVLEADAFIDWCSDFAQALQLSQADAVTLKGMREQFERLATAARACQIALGPERLGTLAAEYLSSLLYGAVHGSAEPSMLQHGGSGSSSDRSIEVGRNLRRALRGRGGPAATLELTFEALAAVEAASRHAAEALEVRRGFDLREARGRQLVDLVLDAYAARFNGLPPAGLSTWFTDVMSFVGQRAGLVSGPKICHAAILDRRA